MTDDELKAWIDDQCKITKLTNTLKMIRKVCEEAFMGGWRFKIAKMVDEGLKDDK